MADELKACGASDISILEPILWSEMYAIGVPLIDYQHRHLFEMIEEVRRCYVEGRPGALTLRALKGMVSYCAEHFESEELLLQMIEYPKLAEHQQVHRMFVAKALSFVAAYKDGSLDLAEMLRIVTDWLISHVMSADVEFVQFCHRRKVDLPSIRTVTDLANSMEKEIEARRRRLGLVPSITLRLVPCLGLFLVFALYDASWLKIGLALAAAAVQVGLFLSVALFARHYTDRQSLPLRLVHARRLAESLVAGEIAIRVKVMDLDSVESLFLGFDGSLVISLQEIVDNLQHYLPYLPAAVLHMARNTDTEEEEPSATTNDGKARTLSLAGSRAA
eukprot:RCo013425